MTGEGCRAIVLALLMNEFVALHPRGRGIDVLTPEGVERAFAAWLRQRGIDLRLLQ